MLNKFLFTKIKEEDIGNIWFHTAEATLDILRPVLENRIISRRDDIVWPPQSCDLISLDYYLWGAVIDKCYADKRRILATFGYNRTALRATHSMFCALFLKIALSAAELNVIWPPRS